MEELHCTICNKIKPIEMFSKNRTKKRGYSFWCKNCTCIKKEGRDLLGLEGYSNYKSIEFSNNTKICTNCNEIKNIEDFKNKGKYKKFSFCNICHKKKIKAKYYGISVELYERLILEQNNLCKICKKPNSNGRDLSIDHCHITGKVRGLLCNNCNVALGLLKENILVLEEAIRYLKNKS